MRLAGDARDRCRRRVQQAIHGHRGRAGDPLYRARRTLHTGADLTATQHQRLEQLFATPTTTSRSRPPGGVYQRMITAYREPDPRTGREVMTKLIDSISRDVPATLTEIITLCRTLKLSQIPYERSRPVA